MGNKFGNFASQSDAENALVADGFRQNDRGFYTKPSVTGGNLFQAPRKTTALVEITSYRVDGKYAADGKDYHVFQHHFL